MCGINGIIALQPIESIPRLIKNMNQQLSRRGPDDDSIWINTESTMGMGMRRLAIVDADFAKQPWHEKDFCLCFNGEIYNYKELIHVEHLECKTSSASKILVKCTTPA